MSDFNRERLLAFMQTLSMKHYHCTWANGIEYTLWHWMHHDDNPLSQADTHRLYILHNRCKGWFALLDEPSEGSQFLTTDRWIRLFSDEFNGENY